MNWSDFFQNILPISGIILAFVPAIVPVVLAPILDYSVSKPSAIENSPIYTSDITITNVGIFSANNVTVSIIADGLSISDIYSEPYLPNDTKSYNSESLDQNGRAIFTIDKLLPHSSWKLHVTMNNTGLEMAKLITYVQSEESIGYHGVLFVILAYLTVGATLTFLSLYIFTPDPGKYRWIGVWGPGIVCIGLCALFLGIHNDSIPYP